MVLLFNACKRTQGGTKQLAVITRSKLGFTIIMLMIILCVGAAITFAIEGENEKDITGKDPEVYSYKNCLYFSVITSTTIGYGDFFPITTGGRIWVMIYALISLGIVGYAVGILGDVIIQMVAKAHASAQAIAIKAAEAVGRKPTDVNAKPSWLQRNNQLIVSLLAFLFLVMLGAIVFGSIEHPTVLDLGNGVVQHNNWNFFDALWFTFITMSTIGYGDLLPKTEGGRATACILALLGLGVVGTLIGHFSKMILESSRNLLGASEDPDDITAFVAEVNGMVAGLSDKQKARLGPEFIKIGYLLNDEEAGSGSSSGSSSGSGSGSSSASGSSESGSSSASGSSSDSGSDSS
eukprot:TRINITY_DN15328_c1_g1_i3.p2 TRINITY_DN15328_c1_g1~~TRINITY_DN15328_c1_g1_i3.p2  ORF type:complete len:357 (-),score=126.65 TRINITY_DN15328_c1_g1_i3:219-1268(-)